MATPVLIPVEEYLRTTYRPDRDYIDGEVKERNVGERPHGLLQGILFTVFQSNRRSWGLLPILEQRVQTSEENFRVPDLCLVRPGESDPIVRQPPLLCIEVMSSGDSLPDTIDRAADYLRMGVEHVWIIDPRRRAARQMSGHEVTPAVEALFIPGTPVRIELAAVFAELDDLLAGRL